MYSIQCALGNKNEYIKKGKKQKNSTERKKTCGSGKVMSQSFRSLCSVRKRVVVAPDSVYWAT